MNRKLKLAMSGVGATAILAVSAGVALAATPPFQPGGGGTGTQAPDPYNIGQVEFFNSAGAQVTSGSTLSPMAAYEEAITGSFPTSGSAALLFYTPNSGVAPGGWSGDQASGGNLYPVATAPGALATTTKPVVKEASNDQTLDDYSNNNFPNNDTNAAYQNLYEIRVFAGGQNYASADVSVNQNTHTWTQVYPAVKTNTSTSLGITPASPSTTGTTETFTATVTGGAAGTVAFSDTVDGSLGSAAVSGGTASITKVLSQNTHSVTATFTPTDATTYNGSASTPQSYVVQAPKPADNTSTTLTDNSTATTAANDPITFTAAVADSTTPGTIPTGTVAFVDSVQGPLGSSTVNASGKAVLSTSLNTGGAHTITATYTPASTTAFTGSAGTDSVTLQAAKNTADPQTITVVVSPGALVISTPYTPSNPFSLGTAVLSADGTQLVARGAFGNSTSTPDAGVKPYTGPPAAIPAGQLGASYSNYPGVTITDTRAGDPNWTASAAANDFTSGRNTITSHGFGFTGVTPTYVPGNAQQHVTTTDINPGPAGSPTGGLKDGPTAFASSNAGGDGTVFIYGNLVLNIPTSTPAGTYTSTLTFTIA